MIIFLISHRNHVVTPHLKRLVETVHLRGHNMFYAELTKDIPNYHQLLPLIYSSASGTYKFKCAKKMCQA